MLKSEAEHFVRRGMEEFGAEFTDQQVEALAYAIRKIVGRCVEEAVATFKPGKQGGKPSFFAE